MENTPSWLVHIMSILFGLTVGSFANVLVVRLPRDQSIIRPSSRCPGCKGAIRWWDNIPVVSFLLLGGKCRKCRKPISLRYPLIEVMTAVLFLASEMKFGFNATLVLRDWPFLLSLVVITFIDLEHRIIPDILSLGGLVLGLATCWMVAEPGWIFSILGAFIGFSFFYGLAWAYKKMSGRNGLGGGDIKLLAMLGTFVGPSGVFTTVLVSSVFGSLIGIIIGLRSRKRNLMRMSIPYGPFLVVGALYYYFLGDTVWLQFLTPT